MDFIIVSSLGKEINVKDVRKPSNMNVDWDEDL